MLIFLLTLIPKKEANKEITKYKSILYSYTNVHQEKGNLKVNGFIIEIFDYVIANNVEITNKNWNIKASDIKNKDGLLFTISRGDKKCIPIKINIYDDGKYKVFTKYGVCKPFHTCSNILKYENISDGEDGEYNYEVMKIIQSSYQTNNKDFAPKYELYDGRGERYILGNNEFLNEFLSSINVNLDTCAAKIYY